MPRGRRKKPQEQSTNEQEKKDNTTNIQDVQETEEILTQEMPKEERVRVFGDYQVNRELMSLGNIGCKFMHCLPATRGEDVTDEVADSDSSLCWDEAGNRLTAMRGLLVYLTQYQREEAASELQIAAAKERLEKFMADRGIN